MNSPLSHPLGLARGMVRVVAYDHRWPDLFLAERARIESSVHDAGLPALRIEHVGSTAVPGLAAKPVLDLLAGHPSAVEAAAYILPLVAAGYEARGPQGVPGRELLVRGSSLSRTHHLHLAALDGPLWHDAVGFRDRLRADPVLAAAYARLKHELAAVHADDRESYTAGKASFIAAALRRPAASVTD